MNDIRTEEPTADGYRKARFQEGWNHASDGRNYNEETLSQVTWQNLGWRLGSIFKSSSTSPELVGQLFEWCVEQQKQDGPFPGEG